MSLVGLLILAATPVAADQPPSYATRPTGQCQVRVVPVTRVRGDRGVGGGPWSVRRVTDLHFEVRMRPGAEGTPLELHVFTPNGHLYRKLQAEVTRNAPGRSAGRRRRPTPQAGTVLPVAGTGIVRNGLYGRWTVVPHLADDPNACGRRAEFELAP
jgi:hypothetical protein